MNGFDVFTYEQYFAQGKCMIREGSNVLSLFETKDAYGKLIIPDDPEMVCQQLMYDPETLTLIEEGTFLKDFNIPIGVWKNYDLEGNVIDEEDMDKDYPVKWNDLKGIMLANDIHLDDVQELLRKPNVEKQPVWILKMKTKHGIREIITVDAVNGDIIERKKTSIKG
jgi:hypothetical protein